MTIDATRVMAHVREVVEADAAGHPADSYEKEGINVLFGAPRFIDSNSIEIGNRTITARKFIVCTGSHPVVPAVDGLDEVGYLTNETVFDLEQLPASMVVLGAGPIGIELAAALNRLGVKVTVLLRSAQPLKKDEKELVDRLIGILRREGLKIIAETKTLSFSKSDNGIIVDVEDKNGRRQLQTDSVLVAVGRAPNLEGLNLEQAGVEYDAKGVKVDRHLRTTAKNIYAAGDVVPPYLFTHMAEYEAIVATTNACIGLPVKKTDYRNVLWSTYTDPELAHAGLTEQQARDEHGDNIRVYRWEHKDIDRAKTDLETRGLTKIICNRKGKILGIHTLGHCATELMHEAQLAKSLGLPFSKIASVIHAYPSYSDAVRQPAKKCYIDILQSNFFLRLLRRFAPKKK